MAKRKRVTMQVTVTCPSWLTAAQARKEVRSLIQHQAHFGHKSPDMVFDEIDEYNFKVLAVKSAKRRIS